MDEWKTWRPKHCIENRMNEWDAGVLLRHGIWMEKEERGIAAEWDLPEAKSRRNFDGLVGRGTTQPSDPSQFLNTLLLLLILCGIKNLWNLQNVNPINPDGLIWNACWPLYKASSFSDIALSLSALNALQLGSYREVMFYNAFRKGTHPPMKWTGWVFTGPLIC